MDGNYHGTLIGYLDHGCRCSGCRRAKAIDYLLTGTHCMGPKCLKPRSEGSPLCVKHFEKLERQVAKIGPHKASGMKIDHLPLGTRGYPHSMVNPARRVLFRMYGPGAFRCLWCGKTVRWDIRYPLPGSLVVDHIDENPFNNDRLNLAISCQPCNVGRTVSRLHAEGGYDAGREWTRQWRIHTKERLLASPMGVVSLPGADGLDGLSGDAGSVCDVDVGDVLGA